MIIKALILCIKINTIRMEKVALIKDINKLHLNIIKVLVEQEVQII